MIYLTGSTNDRDEPALITAGIGLMVNPGTGYHRRADRYPWYAADLVGMNNRGDVDDHLAWLDRMPRERCLFITAPDDYPNARASQERGLSYAPLIRDMGFPVAVVAQDGAEGLHWPWDELDCLFIGGERQAQPWTEWKVSEAAAELVSRARSAGKWCHMGRVSSLTRMKRARSMGCHSADGTFLKYRRRVRVGETDERDARGAVELDQWITWLRANPELPYRTFETPSLPIHKEAAA